MRYKDRIVEIARHYLLMKFKTSMVDKILGGWNYAERKDSRNESIESAIVDVKEILTLVHKFHLDKIDVDSFKDQIKKIIE